MARKKQSVFDDIIDVVALFPWWVGVILAIVSYILLHAYATQEVVIKTSDPNFVGQVGLQLYKTLATFGQYLLPMAFSFGALGSVLRRKQRGDLFKSAKMPNGKDAIRKMSWQAFEILIGEVFRQQGFSVSETGAGADGGIDLVAKKDGKTYLIQCKHWKQSKVGVNVIREHLGVLVSQGASGGYVVTSGVFTEEAKAFAQQNKIKLFDGDALYHFIQHSHKSSSIQQASSPVQNSQMNMVMIQECPVCGQAMVKRTAKKGPKMGNTFWGCSQYPKCRGVISI